MQIVTQLQTAIAFCSEPTDEPLDAAVVTMMQQVRKAAVASAHSDRVISYFDERIVPKPKQNFQVQRY